MDIVLLKLVLLLLMILGVLAAGLLPVRVLKMLRQNAARASTSRKHKNISLILCLLTCFSGGVFLATCFLHLFPELSESVRALPIKYDRNHWDYPIAELLSCLGFFLLFFIEEVVIMALPSMAHGHSHGHHLHSHGGHHDDMDDMPEKKAENGGCCMTSLPPVISNTNEEKSDKSDGTDEPMLIGKGEGNDETDGHCQKHCPLTVHRRHSAGLSIPDCNQDTPELLTTVILAEPERCEINCEEDEDPPILMKSSPHAHSHGIRSITFLLAISFHELIEGVAFGVQGDVSKVSALFLSLMVHKVLVSFSMGLQLARTHAHQLHLVIISIVILSLTSPVGALFGMLLTGGDDSYWKDVMVIIMQGMAVGTFLYVTFFEVLLHERDNEHPNLLKLLFMLIGFTFIGLLRLIDDHDHGDDNIIQSINGTVSSMVFSHTGDHHDHSHHGHGHSH